MCTLVSLGNPILTNLFSAVNLCNIFQEKMYEFEQNKKNNLILYGVTVKHPETSESLRVRIANVFRDHLNIRREITIQKASRVHTGKYFVTSWSEHREEI